MTDRPGYSYSRRYFEQEHIFVQNEDADSWTVSVIYKDGACLTNNVNCNMRMSASYSLACRQVKIIHMMPTY